MIAYEGLTFGRIDILFLHLNGCFIVFLMIYLYKYGNIAVL